MQKSHCFAPISNKGSTINQPGRVVWVLSRTKVTTAIRSQRQGCDQGFPGCRVVGMAESHRISNCIIVSIYNQSTSHFPPIRPKPASHKIGQRNHIRRLQFFGFQGSTRQSSVGSSAVRKIVLACHLVQIKHLQDLQTLQCLQAHNMHQPVP